ncbi:unnamed protein product [Tenebrio molitor]|nr:unnamed protein product [Tenebrio molitor]
MEFSQKCIHEYLENLKRLNKCDSRIFAFVLWFFSSAVLMVAFILCLVMPEDLLYEVYYFKYQNYILYILLAVILHLFLTCMLMFYGLKTNKSWCILIWIITMIIYWNVHLATSVICIVTYVVDGLESQVDKTSHKTICLFFVQAIWLFIIAYMWYYWKKMKEINNVANLVQYVAERSTSLISFHRGRSNEAPPAPSGS